MAGMLIPFTRRSHVATRQPAHGWHGWRLGCGWIGLLEAAATLASAGAMAPSSCQAPCIILWDDASPPMDGLSAEQEH